VLVMELGSGWKSAVCRFAGLPLRTRFISRALGQASAHNGGALSVEPKHSATFHNFLLDLTRRASQTLVTGGAMNSSPADLRAKIHRLWTCTRGAALVCMRHGAPTRVHIHLSRQERGPCRPSPRT
jgi:hypothetical protein